MKAIDFAADAAQNYKIRFVGQEIFGQTAFYVKFSQEPWGYSYNGLKRSLTIVTT